MSIKRKITVETEHHGKRLDLFLQENFPDKTRSFFTKNIKNNSIMVNGVAVKPGQKLVTGDIIAIDIVAETTNLQPADIRLDIIFEDEAIIVVNKPAGITVHPGTGTAADTLVNALLNYTRQLAFIGSSDRPGIVHRLDKNTSGLLVVAKSDAVHRKLQKQFDTKTIHRTYQALVWGIPAEGQGTIHTFINRSRKDPTKMAVTKTSGKEAITHWKALREFTYFTLLQFNLETGRTHQIRLHSNFMGCPIVGDPDYNGRETQLPRLPSNLKKRGHHLFKLLDRQFLHAIELTFIHPLTNQPCTFKTPLPADLQNVLDKINDLFLL